MQSNASAKQLIFNGRYPYSNFGAQTDRNYPKPDPNRIPQPTTGPNDLTTYNFVVSLRTLTKYTGSDAENFYLITLPSVIDRPKEIQIMGHTIGHNDSSTNIKTVLLSTPIVKQSGYTLDSTAENATVTSSDSVMGIIRVPALSNVDSIFTIATTQIIMKVPIKDQGYSQLVGIPVQFIDSRGRALSVIKQNNDGDLSADGELMIQIVCQSYNPTKQTMRT